MAFAISWLLIGAIFTAGAFAEILPTHRLRKSDVWEIPTGALCFILMGPTICLTWQLGMWRNERRQMEQLVRKVLEKLERERLAQQGKEGET